MAFVRGRTRSGLIGGSYGEIFFASGASTRAAANRNEHANAGGGSANTAPTLGGGSSSGTPGTGATGSGSGGSGAAAGTSGTSSSPGAGLTATDPATLPTLAGSGASSPGNGNGNANGNGNGNAGGNGNGNGPAPIKQIPTAVNPEPSTWLLLGTALCGFFFFRARQAQSRA